MKQRMLCALLALTLLSLPLFSALAEPLPWMKGSSVPACTTSLT